MYKLIVTTRFLNSIEVSDFLDTRKERGMNIDWIVEERGWFGLLGSKFEITGGKYDLELIKDAINSLSRKNEDYSDIKACWG